MSQAWRQRWRAECDAAQSKEVVESIAEQDVLAMLMQGRSEMPNRYPPFTAAAAYWKLHFQEVLRSNGAPDSQGSR
jgi:hypothetical protein